MPLNATIQGHEFNFGEPRYAEGHSINANEANALNQVMLENIRNNTASRIKRAAEEQKVKPEEVNLDTTMVPGDEEGSTISLRQSIELYAARYEFGIRAVRSAAPVDPVEREALKIAKETVRKALAAQNIKVKNLPEGKYEELVETYAQRDEIVKEAKRRLKTAESLGTEAMDLGEFVQTPEG